MYSQEAVEDVRGPGGAAEVWDADPTTAARKRSTAKSAAEEWDADLTQRRESTASASNPTIFDFEDSFKTKK